jgi:hypothetical protein
MIQRSESGAKHALPVAALHLFAFVAHLAGAMLKSSAQLRAPARPSFRRDCGILGSTLPRKPPLRHGAPPDPFQIREPRLQLTTLFRNLRYLHDLDLLPQASPPHLCACVLSGSSALHGFGFLVDVRPFRSG